MLLSRWIRTLLRRILILLSRNRVLALLLLRILTRLLGRTRARLLTGKRILILLRRRILTRLDRSRRRHHVGAIALRSVAIEIHRHSHIHRLHRRPHIHRLHRRPHIHRLHRLLRHSHVILAVEEENRLVATLHTMLDHGIVVLKIAELGVVALHPVVTSLILIKAHCNIMLSVVQNHSRQVIVDLRILVSHITRQHGSIQRHHKGLHGRRRRKPNVVQGTKTILLHMIAGDDEAHREDGREAGKDVATVTLGTQSYHLQKVPGQPLDFRQRG